MLKLFKEYASALNDITGPKVIKNVSGVIALTLFLSIWAPVKNIAYSTIVNRLSQRMTIRWGLILFFAYVLIQVVEELASYFQIYYNRVLELCLEQSISHKINCKLGRVKLECLDTHKIYNLVSKANSTIKSSIASSLNILLALYTPIATIILQSASLVLVAWYVPILIIVFNIPYVFTLLKNNRRSHQIERDIINERRKSEYFIEILSDRSATIDIRVYNIVDFLFEKLISVKESIARKYSNLLKKNTLHTIIATSTQGLAMAMALLCTGSLIMSGKAPIGSFVLVYNTGMNLQTALSNLIGTIASLDKFGINITDWNKLMALEEETMHEESHLKSIARIDMEAVEFKYPTRSKNILDKINLTIFKGEKIAIVGDNGSGKTTLLYLLLGIYSPSVGNVLVNGQKATAQLAGYRERTACLFQEFIHYQLSLKENLSPNDLSHLEQDSLIAFTKNFPNGVKSCLGSLDVNSIELSGGQWKRIALYRAIHKKGTDLLVLDEPTANLDPEISEALLIRLLASTNKTVVVVTHDLELAKRFDRIIEVKAGKIARDCSSRDFNLSLPSPQ